jgi:hypothetical protein
MSLNQSKNEKIEELAKTLVSSKCFDTFFGAKTRSRRPEQSNSFTPTYPTVIIEPRMSGEIEGKHIAGLIKEAGFSYTPCDQEPLSNGRVEILPELDPEIPDIEKVALLVNEIQHQVWLLEQKTMSQAETDRHAVLGRRPVR